MDMNINSVGHSLSPMLNNDTLLTRPRKKKKKSVQNAYTENHALYEQMMKLVVSDEGQSLVTSTFNHLMQNLLQLQRGKSVVGGLATLPNLEVSPNRKRQKPFGSPTKGKKS